MMIKGMSSKVQPCIFFLNFIGAGSSSSNGGFDSNGGIIFDNNNNFDNGGFDNTNLDPDINCDRLGTCYDGNLFSSQ